MRLKHFIHDPMIQSAMCLALVLTVAAGVQHTLGKGGTQRGIPRERFWAQKLAAEPVYDVVVAGDSRVYRGVSPARMEDVLTGMKVLNFGFSGVGFESRYLHHVGRLLNQGGLRVIVLGLSVYSLTPEASQNNGYLFRRRRANAWGLGLTITELTQRVPIADILDALRPGRWARIYREDYRPDGWVSSDSVPRDPGFALSAYEEQLSYNKVNSHIVGSLMASVRAWAESGLSVVSFRFPTGVQLRDLEDRLAGVDWHALRADFQAAGGVWSARLSNVQYETYDGSHLSREAALRFSADLAAELVELIAVSESSGSDE